MATLEKIRSKAGLLVVVVGLALFAFIIGDFLNSGSTFFRQRKETVLTIGGQSVGIQDFQAKVSEMEEMYKMQSGNSSVPEEIHAQIRESVFETMVKDILLGEESSKVGFTVSKEELRDLLMGNNISPIVQQMPMFRNQQTGAFDKSALMQFLQTIESNEYANQPDVQSAKKYWLFIEHTVKQQKLEDKFSTLFTKAIVANTLDAKAAFDASNTNVDFDYVAQQYAAIADDQVSVTDAEIQNLYDKRKETFKQEEAISISYIAVDIVPSQEDYANALETLNKIRPNLESSASVADIVNDNSDLAYANVFMSASTMPAEISAIVQNMAIESVTEPLLINSTYHLIKLVDKTTGADSVKINQITLPQLEEKALTHLTDSLINVINKGKSFSDMATELSNGRTNGEMGWMTESSLLKASDEKFKNDVFFAPLNKVFVTTSSFGTHLAQVTERTSPVTKYKIANIQIEVTPSSDTFKDLYSKLTQYIAHNKNLDAFRSAASEAGYFCYTDVVVGKNDQTIGMISNVRPLIRWAYGQKKGKISEIFECQDKFVVAAVEGLQQEGYRPLASVSDMLKRELINEKKAEKIVTELKSKQFNTLEEYAEAMFSPVQSVQFVNFATNRISGVGIEPIITATAPLAEVGKIYPLQGNEAVYVLKVTEKRDPESEFNLEIQKQIFDGNNTYRFRYQLMQVLKEKQKVEDNRIRFY